MAKGGGILRALFERPKNIGFRFGFFALVLVMLTAVFPAFVSIGIDDPQIASFQGMFLTGLVGTLFFSVMLRNASQSKRNPDGGIVFSPQVVNKQLGVLMIGVLAGLVMIISNSLIYNGGNLLTGAVSAKGLYLGMLAGVSEELFFRGFIGTFFRLVAPNLVMALVPSALIFALFHYFVYSELLAFIVLFVLGIILGLIHEFTNDIGAPMLAHVLNNTFAMMPSVLAVLTNNIFIIVGVAVLFIVLSFSKGFARKGRIR